MGLVLSKDMNWTDEMETRLAKWSHKLMSLMRLKCVANMAREKHEQAASTPGGG